MGEMQVSLRQELEPLFKPRSVAVIGATNNWSKWGFSTFTSLLDGFEGRVYPINHRDREVLGHKAYPRVTDIPDDEPLDFAVFVIPAEKIPPVMEDCVRRGVRAGVIISAGFAETGAEGKRLQDEVLRIARRGPLRFIGPNCMGFWSAEANLRAFMFPLPVRDGPLALVSQGGNVGGSLVSASYDRGVGFRYYVSCGCTADIQIEDYIEYFAEDPEVKVILAYIEGLNDGKRFIEKVRRVSAIKPVIALKPGRTEAASLAITSHSGSMAGSSMIYDSAFRKAGVLRVDTPEDLLNTAIGFVTQPLPRGRNVAVITPGGSYGVLSADACATRDLNLVKLSQETIAEFDRIFPPRWSHGNPVDPAGDRNFIAYMKAPELLLKLPYVDALIFMGFSGFSGMASRFSSASGRISKAYMGFVKGLLDVIPDEASVGGPEETDTGWMERLVERMVGLFFSMFGTSDATEVSEFCAKLNSLLRDERSGPALREAFRTAAATFRKDVTKMEANPFSSLFQALMQALLQSWIDDYGKPVFTTSFMGTTTGTEGSLYEVPTADHAAVVLSKMLEYRRLLEQGGCGGQRHLPPSRPQPKMDPHG